MCEHLLQRIVKSPSDSHHILNWLQGLSFSQDDSEYSCSRSDFSTYFVNYIRVNTQGILNSDENIKSITNENQNIETSALSHKPDESTLDFSISSDQNLKDELSDEGINTDKSQEKIFDGKNSTPHTSSCVKNQISHSKNDSIQWKTPESPQNIIESSVPQKAKTDSFNSSSERNSFEILTTPKRNLSYDKSFAISPITPLNANQSKDFDNSYKFSTPTPNRSSYDNTPNSKFSTPPNNHYKDRRSSNQRNICIADFMMTNKSSPNETSTKKKKNRFLNLSLNDPLINSSNRNLNFNNTCNDEVVPFNIEDRDMFPSTLNSPNQNYDAKSHNRNNRRRIKPTKLNNTFPNDNQLKVNVDGTSSIKFGVKYDKAEQNDAFKIQNCQIAEHHTDFETERDILKKEKISLMQKFNEISAPKNILTSSVPINTLIPNNSFKKCIVEFDLGKVDNVDILNIFASIFSIIVDSNLIPNILSEIYYLISLIMIEMQVENTICSSEMPAQTEDGEKKAENCDITDKLFDNVHNVIYFSLSCLEKQKIFLGVILDKNSMRLFLKNYNIEKYSVDFAESLTQMLANKVAIDEKNLTSATCDNLNRNVYFISETDNAENFPTKRDFLTFKSQRDAFYEIYREWESKHQLSGWNYNRIAPKIKSLVNMSSSPSNLTHLARLFKAQLLVTCTEEKKIEKQETLAHLQSVIGNAGVNQDKLNKLTERLTAALPEQILSMDQNNLTKPPNFTGYEEFFSNFIHHSSNSNFREHLINAIIEEIYKLEESGWIPSENEDSGTIIDKEAKMQYTKCLKSLRILAKFLGFLMSLPYEAQEGFTASKMADTFENKENPQFKIIFSEISVRNMTLPPIDLIVILNDSYKRHQLILTIPWIVQLLAMLDHCSLRLIYFKKLHQMLFDIYSSCVSKPNDQSDTLSNQQINDVDKSVINIPNDNKLLIRICLGWLFDLQSFPRDLFHTWLKFRSSKGNNQNSLLGNNQNVQISVFSSNGQLGLSIPEIKNSESIKNDDGLKTSDLNNDDIKKMYNMSLEMKEDDRIHNLDSLKIIDHNVISEACPYLKDFRILFMKNKKFNNSNENVKNIRHITPVTSSFNVDKSKKKQKDLQVRLEEWFLRSQPGTTRRTLDLVSERTGAALVRLAKTQIPTYSARAYDAAKDHINNFVSDKNAFAIAEIYNRELLDFHLKCKKAGQHIGLKRVRCALLGLLPPGTHASIQDMCIQICTRNAVRKLMHCLETQYNDINVLFEGNNFLMKALSNINNDYFAEQRIVIMHQFSKENVDESNKSSPHLSNNNSKIYDDIYYSPSLLIIELKERIIEILSGFCIETDLNVKINLLFKKIYGCIQYPYVDKLMKHVFMQLSIDLTLCIICSNPNLVNEEYLLHAANVWRSCCDCSSNTTDVKPDVSSLEIAYFEKLMKDERFIVYDESTNKFREINYEIGMTSIEDNSNCSEDINVENRSLNKSHSSHTPNYFNTFLCSRNLSLINIFYVVTKNASIWTTLENLLEYLLNSRFLTTDSLVEQFVALYRQDWPQDFLSNISKCMKNLMKVFKLHHNEKLSMLLEFMSDFCNDLDNY